MGVRSGRRRVLRAVRRGLQRPLDARVVFLHVPKCGGNSIRVALQEACRWPFSTDRSRFYHDRARRSQRVAEMVGRPVEELRDELLRYHLCERRIRLATGHFDWPSDLRKEFPDVSFVTLLREPVSHFLSSYFYRREEHAQSGQLGTTLSLEEFVETDRARSVGSRFVTAFAGRIPLEEAANPDVLARATRRLASVEVLGVLEDLPAFTDAFCARFGTRLVIDHVNAGQLRPHHEREQLTDALRARIEQIVRPNRVLYDFAIEELRSRTAALS